MPSLLIQNAYLTEMLKQAGLDAEARDVAQRIQIVLTDEIHHRMTAPSSSRTSHTSNRL